MTNAVHCTFCGVPVETVCFLRVPLPVRKGPEAGTTLHFCTPCCVGCRGEGRVTEEMRERFLGWMFRGFPETPKP